MKSHKEFLASLHQNPRFKDWVEDIERETPRMPSFDPNDHRDGSDMWIYYSGMIDGYKLLASHLGVKLDE